MKSTKTLKITLIMLNKIKRYSTLLWITLPAIGLPSAFAQEKNVQAPQKVASPFTLRVQPAQEEFASSEPVIVWATVKNITPQPQLLPESFGPTLPGRTPTDHRLLLTPIVRDSQGKERPLTVYAQRIFHPAILISNPGLPIVSIAPNEEVRMPFLLGRFIDLTDEGEYTGTLQLSTLATKGPGFNLVESAPFKIRIVETKPDDARFLKPITDEPVVERPVPNFAWDSAPSKSWKLGDQWLIKAELYMSPPDEPVKSSQMEDLRRALERAHMPKETAEKLLQQAQQREKLNLPVPNRYSVLIQVAGEAEFEGKAVWRVQFLPSYSAPVWVRDSTYEVWIGKEDGQTHALHVADGDELPMSIIKAKGLSFLAGTKTGYPLEMFPVTGSAAHALKVNQQDIEVTLSVEPNEQGRWVQAQIKPANGQGFTVRQRWVAGASWWSEYELVDKDRRVTLRAQRMQVK